jgi:hypothetical protein
MSADSLPIRYRNLFARLDTDRLVRDQIARLDLGRKLALANTLKDCSRRIAEIHAIRTGAAPVGGWVSATRALRIVLHQLGDFIKVPTDCKVPAVWKQLTIDGPDGTAVGLGQGCEKEWQDYVNKQHALAQEFLAWFEAELASQADRQPEGLTTEPPSDPDDQFEFRRVGKVWHIQFRQESDQFPVKGIKGLSHLAKLLTHPYQHLTGLVLQERNPTTQGPTTFQAVSDPPALERYRAEAADLESQLNEARQNNDPAKVEYLSEQLHKFLEQIQASTGLGGRPRRLGADGPKVKAFQAVQKSINRAYEKLGERCPGLVAYLKKTIWAESSEFTYIPDIDPTIPLPICQS